MVRKPSAPPKTTQKKHVTKKGKATTPQKKSKAKSKNPLEGDLVSDETMLGPEPAQAWVDSCEHVEWFTEPGAEYRTPRERTPEKTKWSPQSTQMQKALTAIYEGRFGCSPWDAGWRWEKEPDAYNHRWFPPQTVVDERYGGKMAPMGLSSPQAKALLESL